MSDNLYSIMVIERFLAAVFVWCILATGSCHAQTVQDGEPSVFLVKADAPGHASLSGMRIRDIEAINKADTVSYALGVVWANGIAKVGRNTISAAFYSGVLAYMRDDRSVMDVYKAEKLLDSRFEKMKYDPAWPVIDGDMTIADIRLGSTFDTLSYALGVAWCRGAKQQGITDVTPALLAGLSKSLKGEGAFFDYAAADKYLWGRIETMRAEKFSDIRRRNAQWLAQNKIKKDVVTLPSGLQYKVLKNGNGKTPKAEDRVECTYVARLIDGIAFESSFADNDGKPLKLFTSGGIKGWQEAFLLMKEGDVWELYIPYHLAYGSGGMKDYVPPFATVIYEMALVGVDDSQF
jgi:FKBP-type peptidyl-prolyl cis-trans isomerase FklB